MKKKKRQQGFTLVETIVACALLMMLISIFGSITIFTLNLSYREKEAAQVEIMADTLANRVDEILRGASQKACGSDEYGYYIDFVSPDYPKYGTNHAETARLHVYEGKLCINYSGKDYPVGYLLLPDDSYEHMAASFKVVKDEKSLLRLNITLNGTKYHTSYSRDFTVLLPNC